MIIDKFVAENRDDEDDGDLRCDERRGAAA